MTTNKATSADDRAMRRRSALAATAYHEAGHAVAAWRLGVKVFSVTIEPSADYLGLVNHKNPLRGVDLDSALSAKDQRKVETYITIALAGDVAQRRFAPRSCRSWHTRDDYRLAAGLAADVSGSPEMASAYLRWLSLCTERTISASWHFVDALAKELLSARTLDAEATLAAIRRPMEEDSRRVIASFVGKPETIVETLHQGAKPSGGGP